MCAAILSQGVAFTWDASPIGEVIGFDGPAGKANVIDTTHLGSTAKEKAMGLADEGQINLDLNLVPADAGQVKLRNDRTSRTKRQAVLTLTDALSTTLTFEAYCLNFSIAGKTDDKITAKVTLEITGPVAWS